MNLLTNAIMNIVFSLVPRLSPKNRERRQVIASFPGSPEREINTRGEPGIFSHVIKIGPEFLEQKGNVLRVIQPTLRSTLGVYDIRSPIARYV